MDELQASLREQKIQNHRLESQVGELEIRITHHLEDLTKARAERDQFEEKFKDASGRLSALGEELKQVRAKYETPKLQFVPQACLYLPFISQKLIQTSKMPLSDLKRKLDSEAQDVRQLAPAFREQHSNAERHFVRIILPVSWSHSDMIPSQFLSPRQDPRPTTPQRPSMLSNLSSSSESSSTSVTFFRFNANIVNLLPIQADTSSPRTSPIPGLQADLRAIGMHSTPWSQHGNSNRSFLLQSSPAIVSTRLTPTPGMPATLDSLRTTDPRKTPTTTTTTRITQTQISTVQQQIDLGLPKRPRAMPIPAKPQAPVHEGPRLPSEIRKRTISLTAKPVRSSPHHLGSRRKGNDEQVEVEAGEIRTGYSSGTSSESDSS
ncbi:hypothetical protein C8F04DRAFT_1185592 [Mycena alexandri]|uniref:Uncharacterized protein n=1 Tax=Mycena alexandri TaxID=1745969 RepID=A0AAD6X131_9AGAR|nr:hypothetical protein C8F04DRAFT_1185592 [Mycena alexandri]